MNTLRLILAGLLTLLTLQSLHAQSTPPTITLLEADIQVDLPADQRNTITGQIDTLLTSSFAKQKSITILDRQSLDAVVKEHANNLTGLTANQVSKDLRPFWSAGIILCPVVQQLNAQEPNQPRSLVVHIDTVLAQTGQCLWSIDVPCAWNEDQWIKPPALEASVQDAASQITQNLKQAQAARYIEIAPVKLQSPMTRLLWLTDSMTDSLRASFTRPGIQLLTPRQPASTREERLLRIVGLAAPQKQDAAAGFACTPDYRLESLLTETPGATDLTLEKTPVTLTLTLTRPSAAQTPPVQITLSGLASAPDLLVDKANDWLRTQFTDKAASPAEPDDQAAAKKLAATELALARTLIKLAPDSSIYHQTPRPIIVIHTRILAHALRASHLDPTNQEAAYLALAYIQAPYWLRGDGEAEVSIDRAISEANRFMARFPKSPKASQARQIISSVTFQELSRLRWAAGGDWIGSPRNDNVYRYAKAFSIIAAEDLRTKNDNNFWVDANVIGGAILGHCPPESLEAERALWRDFWKKNVEPLNRDLPPWEYVDMHIHIRNKDHKALRASFTLLAQKYPASDVHIWGGNSLYEGKPRWRERVTRLLTYAGDPDAKTWAPPFNADSFDWNPHAYGKFLTQFNPPMAPVWTRQQAKPLPADIITVEIDPQVRDEVKKLYPYYNPRPPRPIFAAGGSMWFCYPSQGSDIYSPAILLTAPLSELTANTPQPKASLSRMPWPIHPTDGTPAASKTVIRTWLHTQHQGIDTVWVATSMHGLARFDFINNKWQSRWYTNREGLPGEDILVLRPAIHEGKTKILALSLPNKAQLASEQNPNKFLWVLDPTDDKITLLAQSKKWNTSWAGNNDRTEFCSLIALFKNGSKIPLSIYSSIDHPALDVQDITELQNRQDNFFLLRHADAPARLFSYSAQGLTEFDEKLTPRPHIAVTPTTDGIFYNAPGIRNRELPSRSIEASVSLATNPLIRPRLTTSDPSVVWGIVGFWGHSAMWNSFTFDYAFVTAYRPAPPDLSSTAEAATQNDAWYGPWLVSHGVDSMAFFADHLWITTATGDILRCTPAKTLADAAVLTTDQWRTQYKPRLQANWRDHLRMLLVLKSFDEGLRLIQQTRQTQPDVPAAELTTWEALFYAQKGDFPTADKLYTQLAADTKNQPFLRGIAAYSLIHVRYAAKDSPGVITAVQNFSNLFPDLAKPQIGSSATTLNWFLKEANKSQKPNKQPPTSQPANP